MQGTCEKCGFIDELETTGHAELVSKHGLNMHWLCYYRHLCLVCLGKRPDDRPRFKITKTAC